MCTCPLPRLLPVLAAPVLLLSATWPAMAVEPLHVSLKPLAQDCARWLKGRRLDTVVLGTIAGPQTYPTSSGPGIRLTLAALLQEQAIKVKERASIALSLSYRPREAPDARDPRHVRLVVDIRVVFIDSREHELDDLESRIEHEEAVRQILGISEDRKGEFGAADDDRLARLFYEPKAHLDGSVVLAGQRSPYGIEVRVGGKGVRAEERDGLGFAPVPREQEYEVRLVNRSPLDMAARLTIDGISIFSFYQERQPARLPDGKANPRAGEPACDLILVPARGEVTVPGWLITAKKAQGFKVTEYPRTAVAQLGRDSGPTGTITATFSAAWEKEPPRDEPPGTRGPGDDGTGFGRDREVEGKVVQRKVGVVRASVSVRYSQGGR